MDGFALRLAFDTDETEFARGVELGMLYERLRSSALPVVAVVRAENAEMAIRLAEACNLTVRADELDDHWLQVIYDG